MFIDSIVIVLIFIQYNNDHHPRDGKLINQVNFGQRFKQKLLELFYLSKTIWCIQIERE